MIVDTFGDKQLLCNHPIAGRVLGSYLKLLLSY